MKELDVSLLAHDPVEETEVYQALNPTVTFRALANVETYAQRWSELGLESQMAHWIDTMYNYDRFCFEKKKLLMETYGIDWKTPFELNPELYVMLGEDA